MIIYQIGGIADKYRVGSSTKTLSVGKHVLGWAYGYPDAAGNGSLMYRNVKIEVLSGEGVISVVAGEKVDGSSISYVDGQGYISSTNAYSGRNYYGTLNCEKEGTAVLRLHYDLDGMHYTYDLTITVTAE